MAKTLSAALYFNVIMTLFVSFIVMVMNVLFF